MRAMDHRASESGREKEEEGEEDRRGLGSNGAPSRDRHTEKCTVRARAYAESSGARN